jgi:hypothetical protein
MRVAGALAFAVAAHQAAAQPSAATGKTVVYRTQAGDTLYDVAARYLQGPDDWQLLQRINRVPAPKHLQPGTALKLPVVRLRRKADRAHRGGAGQRAALVRQRVCAAGEQHDARRGRARAHRRQRLRDARTRGRHA